MNKTDLIQKVKALDGLSQDERAYLINLVNTKKKYGLVWEDKPEDVEEQLRDNLPVLKEVKDKSIINGEDNPNHILIEGDNLHALTALTFTHEGKIDVIYIDPPYNTGNKDFKYHDAFKDEPEFIDKEHPFRHSTWLSFINKRLIIAKKLLSDNGVIFISIDDNEIAQLKLLCDEILGEKNFIANLVWKKKAGGGSDAKYFANDHEYILVYAKDESKQERFFVQLTDKLKGDYKFKDVNFELLGPYKRKNLYQTGIDANRPNLRYEIKAPDGSNIIPPTIWRWSIETFEKALNENKIDFIKNTKGEWSVFTKMYLYGEEGIEYKIKPRSILLDFGSTKDGGQEIKDIFNSKIFDYPKSTRLLKYLIDIGFKSNKKGLILDFFAGSGTTLHATMALNAEDGGNRQCILVTNNENNICEEVTYERNKRVIQGYNNPKGVAVEGLKNNNLRYFKSEYVSRNPTLKNKKELTRLATELLCIKEDCYTPITKTEKWYDAYSDYKSQFIVIYDDVMIEESISIIKIMYEAKQNSNPIKVYVFSNGQYPYTEDFEEVLPYITLCALPDAIYKAYQNVLPKKKKEIIPVLEDDILGEEENLFNQENE
jgi:adenine-specific DNA-methyltransferase